MLLSKDAIAAAVEVCGPDDFYKPAHGHLFEAITSLYAHGEPADPVTVADELARADLLEAIGGPSVLTDLQANTPAISNAGHYGRIVEEHALLRRLIGVAGEIAELGYAVPDDVEGAIDRAETMMFEVAQRRVTDSVAPLSDLLRLSLDRLEALYEKGESVTGTPSGYDDLDEVLGGLQPSALVVVGARPGIGKTAFALGMAAHAAIEGQRPVLLFSLEMGHHEVTQRLLSAEAKVDSTRLRTGKLLEADWHKISHAIGRLSEAPLYIDDNPNVTVMDIRAKARRLKSRTGDLGLVLVDYLQLMTGRRNAENRQVEVSEISRGLKILARELQCPVVACSQLSRTLETRADKRPMLADLRESGCLTADARVLRSDTGAEVTVGELLLSGETDIPVWSLDRDLGMVEATMGSVFPTGTKETFELRLESGRVVKASANHPFLTADGWLRLDELGPGERIAVPCRTPEPTNPVAMTEGEIVLLAHLLDDGCATPGEPLAYTSANQENLEHVQAAAASFGVAASRSSQGRWSTLRFSSSASGGTCSAAIATWLRPLGLDDLRSFDKRVPAPVFSLPNSQLATFLGLLWRSQRVLDVDDPSRLYSTGSRRLADDLQTLLTRFGLLSRLAVVDRGRQRPRYEVHAPASLYEVLDRASRRAVSGAAVCGPDVWWDEVTSIRPLGPQPVYDATVAETHNFVANGITVENSIEQDSDVVMFVYRDEVYNPESADRGTAEIIIAKHRNGPTAVTRLAFLDRYACFANMARV